MKRFVTLGILVLTLCAPLFAGDGPDYGIRLKFGKKTTIVGSNNYVTKDIPATDFTKIVLTGGMDVLYNTIEEGDGQSVWVFAPDNVMEALDIYVKDGMLHVGYRKGVSVHIKGKIQVFASSKALNEISIAGSGDVIVSDLETDDLTVFISGSGGVTGNGLSCNDLKMSISGTGDIVFKDVTCSNFRTSIAGTGDVNMSNLTAENATLSIVGTGDIKLSGRAKEAEYRVAGTGDIDASRFVVDAGGATITGSGDIKCNIADFTSKTSGTGTIRNIVKSK